MSLFNAIIRNRIDDVAKMLQDDDVDIYETSGHFGDTPLICASRFGRNEIVKLLLDKDGSPEHINKSNSFDRTPLIVALRHGHVEIAKLLLSSDGSPEHINHKDDKGTTALIYASMCGFKEITELLLNGDDPLLRDELVNHSSDNGDTALIYASRYGCSDIIKLLLANDASVDHKNSDDFTALDLVCIRYGDPNEELEKEIRELLSNYEPKNTKRAKGS